MPHPINRYTLVRLLTDYKHKLVHLGCRQMHQEILQRAQKIELMHVTHRELRPRISYFGGLPAEYHVFRLEDSHYKGVDQAFIQVDQNLLTSESALANLHL